jgi:CO dehydrogenase/acetyl-CoA synthase beta subunit
MPPFSIAPEDVDTEIETDERVHDINTLFNRLRDLQRQVREKDQTLREQTEMLKEKDETLREQDQTIQLLLAISNIDGISWLLYTCIEQNVATPRPPME